MRFELERAGPRQGKGAPGHAQLYINETSGPASNADGSIDVWFGTKPPARREKNWIQTVRGKGWFVLSRFYGPLEPYEFAPITSNSYYDWMMHNAYFIYAAQAAAAQFAATFKEFPPVQKPNTFTVDDALAKMHEAAAS